MMKLFLPKTKLTIEKLQENNLKILIPFFCILMLVLLTGAIASDMYVPSLPHIAKYFLVSDYLVKLTVTLYMLGFGFGQLIWGPLSDSFGRKPILILGIFIGFIGSLFCVLATHIDTLLAGRLIQGIGVACSLTLVRSMIRDVLKGDMLAKLLAYLSLIFGMIPAIAPIIGSYIQYFFDWRAVFYVLTVYMVFVIFMITIFLPETVTREHIQPLNLKHILIGYAKTFINLRFLSCAVTAGACISGIIAYVAISPFLFQNELGLSVVHYGWLTIIITLVMLLGRGGNVVFLKRSTPYMAMKIGRILMLAGGLLMLLTYAFHWLSVTVVLIPYLIFLLGTGFIFSNASLIAFTAFESQFGIVSALYSFLQLISAYVTSYIAANVSTTNQLSLGLILTGLAMISIFFAMFLRKPVSQ